MLTARRSPQRPIAMDATLVPVRHGQPSCGAQRPVQHDDVTDHELREIAQRHFRVAEHGFHGYPLLGNRRPAARHGGRQHVGAARRHERFDQPRGQQECGLRARGAYMDSAARARARRSGRSAPDDASTIASSMCARRASVAHNARSISASEFSCNDVRARQAVLRMRGEAQPSSQRIVFRMHPCQPAAGGAPH